MAKQQKPHQEKKNFQTIPKPTTALRRHYNAPQKPLKLEFGHCTFCADDISIKYMPFFCRQRER